MRIALVGARNYPAAHGGIEVAVEHLAVELLGLGHDVHIFVGRSPDSSMTRSSAPVPRLTIHYSGAIPTKYTRTASQILSAIPAIRKIRADVVHVHGVGPAFPLAIFRNVFRSQRVVVTSHGMDWERSKWNAFGKLTFRIVATRALSRASHVTAVSRTVATSLSKIIRRPVDYIPNGFTAPDDVQESSESFAAGSYSVLIARLSPEKNVAFAVKSYDDDCVKHHGRLIVVGSGMSSHSADYESQLRRLAADRAIFTGALDRTQVLELLQGANRFISASLLEAQPLTVLEAMACRAPMVLSDISAHRELADGIARFFDPSSAADFKSAVLDDSDYSERIAWGEALAKSFTWRSSTEQYIAAYAPVESSSD